MPNWRSLHAFVDPMLGMMQNKEKWVEAIRVELLKLDKQFQNYSQANGHALVHIAGAITEAKDVLSNPNVFIGDTGASNHVTNN